MFTGHFKPTLGAIKSGQFLHFCICELIKPAGTESDVQAHVASYDIYHLCVRTMLDQTHPLIILVVNKLETAN